MMKTRLTDNTFTFLTLLLLIAIGFFIVSHFTRSEEHTSELQSQR